MVRPTLSFVLPLHNEEDIVAELAKRFPPFLERLALPAEIVLVDDGSTDATLSHIKALAAADARYRVLSLSRNFGRAAALSAGMDFARGHAVVTMDGDLQDPLDSSFEMVAKWREGFDVVHGERMMQPGSASLARTLSKVLAAITKTPNQHGQGEYRLLSRRAVVALRGLKESGRHVQQLVSWIGFKQTTVLIERADRPYPRTKPSSRSDMREFIEGAVGFSLLPLRLATWAGLGLSLLSVFLLVLTAFIALVWKLPDGMFTAVWMTLLSGVQLCTIGILGEYVGRLQGDARRRPVYVVSDVANLTKTPDDDDLDESGTQASLALPFVVPAKAAGTGVAMPTLNQFPVPGAIGLKEGSGEAPVPRPQTLAGVPLMDSQEARLPFAPTESMPAVPAPSALGVIGPTQVSPQRFNFKSPSKPPTALAATSGSEKAQEPRAADPMAGYGEESTRNQPMPPSREALGTSDFEEEGDTQAAPPQKPSAAPPPPPRASTAPPAFASKSRPPLPSSVSKATASVRVPAAAKVDVTKESPVKPLSAIPSVNTDDEDGDDESTVVASREDVKAATDAADAADAAAADKSENAS